MEESSPTPARLLIHIYATPPKPGKQARHFRVLVQLVCFFFVRSGWPPCGCFSRLPGLVNGDVGPPSSAHRPGHTCPTCTRADQANPVTHTVYSLLLTHSLAFTLNPPSQSQVLLPTNFRTNDARCRPSRGRPAPGRHASHGRLLVQAGMYCLLLCGCMSTFLCSVIELVDLLLVWQGTQTEGRAWTGKDAV